MERIRTRSEITSKDIIRLTDEQLQLAKQLFLKFGPTSEADLAEWTQRTLTSVSDTNGIGWVSQCKNTVLLVGRSPELQIDIERKGCAWEMQVSFLYGLLFYQCPQLASDWIDANVPKIFALSKGWVKLGVTEYQTQLLFQWLRARRMEMESELKAWSEWRRMSNGPSEPTKPALLLRDLLYWFQAGARRETPLTKPKVPKQQTKKAAKAAAAAPAAAEAAAEAALEEETEPTTATAMGSGFAAGKSAESPVRSGAARLPLSPSPSPSAAASAGSAVPPTFTDSSFPSSFDQFQLPPTQPALTPTHAPLPSSDSIAATPTAIGSGIQSPTKRSRPPTPGPTPIRENDAMGDACSDGDGDGDGDGNGSPKRPKLNGNDDPKVAGHTNDIATLQSASDVKRNGSNGADASDGNGSGNGTVSQWATFTSKPPPLHTNGDREVEDGKGSDTEANVEAERAKTSTAAATRKRQRKKQRARRQEILLKERCQQQMNFDCDYAAMRRLIERFPNHFRSLPKWTATDFNKLPLRSQKKYYADGLNLILPSATDVGAGQSLDALKEQILKESCSKNEKSGRGSIRTFGLTTYYTDQATAVTAPIMEMARQLICNTNNNATNTKAVTAAIASVEAKANEAVLEPETNSNGKGKGSGKRAKGLRNVLVIGFDRTQYGMQQLNRTHCQTTGARWSQPGSLVVTDDRIPLRDVAQIKDLLKKGFKFWWTEQCEAGSTVFLPGPTLHIFYKPLCGMTSAVNALTVEDLIPFWENLEWFVENSMPSRRANKLYHRFDSAPASGLRISAREEWLVSGWTTTFFGDFPLRLVLVWLGRAFHKDGIPPSIQVLHRLANKEFGCRRQAIEMDRLETKQKHKTKKSSSDCQSDAALIANRALPRVQPPRGASQAMKRQTINAAVANLSKGNALSAPARRQLTAPLSQATDSDVDDGEGDGEGDGDGDGEGDGDEASKANESETKAASPKPKGKAKAKAKEKEKASDTVANGRWTALYDELVDIQTAKRNVSHWILQPIKAEVYDAASLNDFIYQSKNIFPIAKRNLSKKKSEEVAVAEAEADGSGTDSDSDSSDCEKEKEKEPKDVDGSGRHSAAATVGSGSGSSSSDDDDDDGELVRITEMGQYRRVALFQYLLDSEMIVEAKRKKACAALDALRNAPYASSIASMEEKRSSNCKVELVPKAYWKGRLSDERVTVLESQVRGLSDADIRILTSDFLLLARGMKQCRQSTNYQWPIAIEGSENWTQPAIDSLRSGARERESERERKSEADSEAVKRKANGLCNQFEIFSEEERKKLPWNGNELLHYWSMADELELEAVAEAVADEAKASSNSKHQHSARSARGARSARSGGGVSMVRWQMRCGYLAYDYSRSISSGTYGWSSMVNRLDSDGDDAQRLADLFQSSDEYKSLETYGTYAITAHRETWGITSINMSHGHDLTAFEEVHSKKNGRSKKNPFRRHSTPPSSPKK